jgi:hypothetical protein
MESKDTSGGFFQKTMKKKQFLKTKKKSPKICNVQWLTLMGLNMTAKFCLPLPASAELNNINKINWLVSPLESLGYETKQQYSFVCPSAWQDFEAGPSHARVFVTVSFCLNKPLSQIMDPPASCWFITKYFGWMLRHGTCEKRTEENTEEENWKGETWSSKYYNLT